MFPVCKQHVSAWQIKRLTLKKIEMGQELPESTPVERKAIPPLLAATSIVEAGSPTL